jgi:hypothetical protein
MKIYGISVLISRTIFSYAVSCPMAPSFKKVAEIRVFVAFLANKATILAYHPCRKINYFVWNSSNRMKK